MVRLEGWERRLSEYIQSSKAKTFEWGVNDCILYAVKAVEQITGINTYSEYLGYTTEEGANEIIKDNGGIVPLISKHFGPSHRNVLKARRGDLAAVRIPHICIGVVDDSGQYVSCVSDEGYSRIPLNMAWRIWSYG